MIDESLGALWSICMAVLAVSATISASVFLISLAIGWANFVFQTHKELNRR